MYTLAEPRDTCQKSLDSRRHGLISFVFPNLTKTALRILICLEDIQFISAASEAISLLGPKDTSTMLTEICTADGYPGLAQFYHRFYYDTLY